MTQPGRGWDHGERFRPAREVEVRYGHGLVTGESVRWPRYIAVANRTAWQNVQKYLARTPQGVGIVRYLDWGHLEEVSQSLTGEADLVVGIGGGTALDASKYVALRKELPLRLVPAAVSTGAIIHGAFAKWQGRAIIGGVEEWPYCDFEHVLVDYDLVLEAPEHLNTAGLGDVLCMYSGIAEWRYSAARGRAPAVDERLVRPTLQYYQEVADGFPKTLTNNGRLTPASVKFIMTAVHERDDRQLKSPHSSGAGHSMTGPLEQVTQRTLVHGEMAALGSVIVCWAAGEPEQLVDWMDRCRVRYGPGEMGISKDELRSALAFAPEFMASRKIDTVLALEPVTGPRFESLWRFLQQE